VAVDGNPAGGGLRFTVGGVISISLAALFGNFFRILGMMLVVFVPLVGLITVAAMIGLAGSADGLNFTINDPNGAQVALFILFALLMLGAWFLLQSALTLATLQHLQGQPPRIGDCLARGLRAMPVVFAASLLFVIVLGLLGLVAAMIIGSILAGLGAAGMLVGLLFGAAVLYVYSIYWVFVPALLLEGAGILECFGRSAELTRGFRGKIFAILVLVAVANWVIAFANQLLVQAAPVAGSVIDIGSGLLFLALSPVLATVGYYHLRAEKEGLGIDDVVRVFD
jgi:hypothetical protein